MKVLLMHPDRDWAEEPGLTERFRYFRREPRPQLPPSQQTLVRDMALDTLVTAMAGGDEYLFEAAERALLSAFANDITTIRYRQDVLKDCLNNQSVVAELYGVVMEAIGGKRKHYIAEWARYPTSILYSAIEALQWYAGMLRKLRDIAAARGERFASQGLTALFAMLQREFNDEYLATIQQHLDELKLRGGTFLSAALGKGNEGTSYALHRPRADDQGWFKRIFAKTPPGFTFYVHERDEAGARALGELRDRGINAAVNALAQSTDHILSFFEILRAELAFYVACLNVHGRLQALGVPICFPEPHAVTTRRHRFAGLCDAALALEMNRQVVGNTVEADGKSLLIVTGANQGGKSTFLRSVGVAQIMMQCGMFVAADAFAAELTTGLFTHYKREEDATMKHGKLDEELARMSEIVDAIKPNALVLFNESFASTDDLEGSEIARQVVAAMLEKHIKVCFVTHLYQFARGVFDARGSDALFLRAEREPDGRRSFRLALGEPRETSYGEDLYDEVFVDTPAPLTAGS